MFLTKDSIELRGQWASGSSDILYISYLQIQLRTQNNAIENDTVDTKHCMKRQHVIYIRHSPINDENSDTHHQNFS